MNFNINYLPNPLFLINITTSDIFTAILETLGMVFISCFFALS